MHVRSRVNGRVSRRVHSQIEWRRVRLALKSGYGAEEYNSGLEWVSSVGWQASLLLIWWGVQPSRRSPAHKSHSIKPLSWLGCLQGVFQLEVYLAQSTRTRPWRWPKTQWRDYRLYLNDLNHMAQVYLSESNDHTQSAHKVMQRVWHSMSELRGWTRHDWILLNFV